MSERVSRLFRDRLFRDISVGSFRKLSEAFGLTTLWKEVKKLPSARYCFFLIHTSEEIRTGGEYSEKGE